VGGVAFKKVALELVKPTESLMLKKVMLGVAATALVAALALPVQFAPAEAAMTCKAAAKAKFKGELKARHAWKKECKAAWKASHKA
jgi:hypothetical protein